METLSRMNYLGQAVDEGVNNYLYNGIKNLREYVLSFCRVLRNDEQGQIV